ncbi:hypothetical protein ACETU7_07275 [Rhodococcus sp. 3Y1]
MTLLLTTRAAEDSYQLSDARAYNQSLVEQKAALERDFQSRNSAPELANQASALGMVPAKDPARLVVHPTVRSRSSERRLPRLPELCLRSMRPHRCPHRLRHPRAPQRRLLPEPRRAFRITRETSRRVNNWFL